VLDGAQPFTSEDQAFLAEFAGKKRLLVRNKCDLPPQLDLPSDCRPVLEVCCLTGRGIEGLKDAIKNLLWSGQIPAEALEVTINSRHQDALNRARAAAVQGAEALRGGLGLELVAVDLRIAANAVGEVVGMTATEDLLDAIFSQFCIGK
jgi:tRNA modification GTPase